MTGSMDQRTATSGEALTGKTMMSVILTDEQWDQISDAIETLDNLQTSLVNLTGLSDRIHVEALRSGMPKAVEQAMKVVEAIDA